MEVVKPTNHASLKSSVVPVLPRDGKPHAVDRPRRRCRAAVEHVLEHRDHLIRDLRRDDAILRARDCRRRRRRRRRVTRVIARGRTAMPPLGNAAIRGGQIERRHQCRCRATATARRADRCSPTSDASRRTGRDPIRCCSSAARAVVRSRSARRASVRVSATSPFALRGAHSSGPCGAIDGEPVQQADRRIALRERRGDRGTA